MAVNIFLSKSQHFNLMATLEEKWITEWDPRLCVLNFVPIHSIVVDIFHSGGLTGLVVPGATPLAWLKKLKAYGVNTCTPVIYTFDL